ncbi:hypothetical protein AB0K60_13760 [Thermopolyspora sp. NPDC052614]|uniref:hypothetical protein n=1 Tax=Thermopolyspora sp. NPDC052614 TaxID=3155682 RepID=UPI0034473794
MTEDWKKAWQPIVDSLGAPRPAVTRVYGADLVERGVIRRYLEPLEFDCALHYDPHVARRTASPT